jgi:hypothetical protein
MDRMAGKRKRCPPNDNKGLRRALYAAQFKPRFEKMVRISAIFTSEREFYDGGDVVGFGARMRCHPFTALQGVGAAPHRVAPD